MSCEVIEFGHVFTAGDQLPEIIATLADTDLTDYTITLHLEKPDGTIVVIAATAIDLPHGRVKFSWGATDLVEGSGQTVEIQYKDASNKELTSQKFTIDVIRGLA